MNKQYFEQNAIMVVEVEYEDGGRCRHTMRGSEVKAYIDRLEQREGVYLSDVDYAGNQECPEIREILDKAWEIFMKDSEKFGSYDKAIDSLLEETPAFAPAKRVWTEDEVKELVQTNDKVLYGALRKLYAEQTADERRAECTRERNGAGFNSVDAKFLSSVAEFLKCTGFLTEKQKYVTRKKLVKYNKQLTRLANA
jgi:hypothetical protein